MLPRIPPAAESPRATRRQGSCPTCAGRRRERFQPAEFQSWELRSIFTDLLVRIHGARAMRLPVSQKAQETNELPKAGFRRKRSGFRRLRARGLLAPSPREFCTLSSALTCHKMETRLFKGSHTAWCSKKKKKKKKPHSSVNVNGAMTVMQAQSKLFYLIEAEGTERE